MIPVIVTCWVCSGKKECTLIGPSHFDYSQLLAVADALQWILLQKEIKNTLDDFILVSKSLEDQVRLSVAARVDITWWYTFVGHWNGLLLI